MPRQTQKPKRKAATVHVPDLTEDGAERKRVLNVLAQRRYRERKREHLKKLESQVESSTSPPTTATVLEHRSNVVQDQSEGLGTGNDLAEIAVPPESSPILDFTTSSDLIGEGVDGDGMEGAWVEPFEASEETWPAMTLLPSLFPNPSSTSSSSSNSDRATSSTTPPSSLGSPEWPSFHDIDTTSALQVKSTSEYTFPDERHTTMIELRLLLGSMMIARRMNIEDILFSIDATSPFTDPSLAGLSFDHLPHNLRPTPTQQLIPHHPMFDIIAWPSVRDKLIMVFSQPPEMRPPVAQSPMALFDLTYDIEDSAEGFRIWGQDPYNAENWEVGEVFFKKWWWALDSKIVERSNMWRRERGASLLTAGKGFVVGEV